LPRIFERASKLPASHPGGREAIERGNCGGRLFYPAR
jgi:hypothetical protein